MLASADDQQEERRDAGADQPADFLEVVELRSCSADTASATKIEATTTTVE